MKENILMIRINDTQYDDYSIKIIWGNFNIFHRNGKETSGKAPVIIFNLKNNILIELEFIFSDNMFLSTKLNVKTNIKEYLSDIILSDNKGYCSLILEKYDCNITRINEKSFNIDFYVYDYENRIFINTNVDLF